MHQHGDGQQKEHQCRNAQHWSIAGEQAQPAQDEQNRADDHRQTGQRYTFVGRVARHTGKINKIVDAVVEIEAADDQPPHKGSEVVETICHD